MSANTSDSENQLLRDVLTTFWDEQFRVETTASGLVAALPLMDASGWQVVVHLDPLTADRWVISDRGETLGKLDDAGRNPASVGTRELVASQCAFYGIERDGLNLRKILSHPFDPVEIQIFAEGLVAVSHLRSKRPIEVGINPTHRMETRVAAYFERQRWTAQRHHRLTGLIEREVVVDFYAEGPRPLAIQPVGRNRHLRDYMQQWGWRWTDLGRAHPELIKAMVFDPDNQDWDPASLRIGGEVCDVFVPYTEAEEALDAALAA